MSNAASRLMSDTRKGVLMLRRFSLAIAMAAVCCAPTSAQQRAQGRGNPGVSPMTIMDTPDVRVTRVQLHAGPVRPSHANNEAPFLMLFSSTGPVQLSFPPKL